MAAANGKGNKRLISVRINHSDHAKVKQLSQRLGVRESDVLRFALKVTLAKLNPLYRPEKAGRDVFSVFIEHGREIVDHFDLDADRLDEIVNGPVTEPAERVDRSDIELIAAAGLSEHYLYHRLNEIADRRIEPTDLPFELRRYLEAKYLFSDAEAETEA